MTNTPQRGLNEQKTQVQDYFSRTGESYVAGCLTAKKLHWSGLY